MPAPLTGGWALQTMGAHMQMLKPGLHTRAHRHTGNVVYNVAQVSFRQSVCPDHLLGRLRPERGIALLERALVPAPLLHEPRFHVEHAPIHKAAPVGRTIIE